MIHRQTLLPLLLAAGLAAAGAAFAQSGTEAGAGTETGTDSETGSDAGGLSTGEPVAAGGEGGRTYVAEEHGDWQLRCIRTDEGPDPCQLYQLLFDGNGTSVAEINVFTVPEGGQAEAGANIVTPLETLLTQQLTIAVDGGPGKRYPFSFCTQIGCIARIGLTGDDLASFRRGTQAAMRIVPAAAPDQNVILTLSLSGFTAGFAALQESAAATE